MPYYDYYCEKNARQIEVEHPVSVRLSSWGMVCYAAQIPLGNTDPEASVERLIGHTHAIRTTSNSALKNAGFVKLVRRDQGVFENLTHLDHEKRYFKAGDASSLPDLGCRIED